MEWQETTILHKKHLQKRFRYFEGGHTCGIKIKLENRDRLICCGCTSCGTRITREWYKPIEYLGEKAKQFIYFLHDIFGKRKKLTERDFERAKELKNERVSEKEYLDRFSNVNAYAQQPWARILWWIRNNITYD